MDAARGQNKLSSQNRPTDPPAPRENQNGQNLGQIWGI